MAASISIDLKDDRSVEDLFSSDVKKFFNHTSKDDKGELVLKEDDSITITYEVTDDRSVTFTVTQTPKLFSDGDWNGMLPQMFA